ncbi:MAG: hypothetical protein QOI80_2332, partial [Solirubrobacteraceae bacterium]|nr:hypothetical protein [Solirubrobacteraceae bacterium]
LLPELEERLRWGADEHPPVVVAQGIVLFLAHRLEEATDDPTTILQLVARAEFHDHPDPTVAQWFVERGVEVAVQQTHRS